ncbi:APC membrane recruitment protein 2 [Discoglossus pictus]
MDLHCDCAESPGAEQPSGKINKAAFKLFGKKKSGSAMPTIFGVKNKGDGKSTSKMGMVRSKTLDGIADVVLESNKKEELCVEAAADKPNVDINTKIVEIKADVSSVAKSHSFFSLLKKNGRSETVKGENAEQKGISRQKKGLKGLFSSMRWSKKDKHYKEDKDGASENQLGLILSGSLTASLECIKEEIPKPLCEPVIATEDLTVDLPFEEQSKEVDISLEEKQVQPSEESPCSSQNTEKAQEEDAPGKQHVEIICQLPDPEVEAIPDTEDGVLTGCGDIIADQDEEGGNSTSAKHVPGNGKKAICKKTPNIVAYQGGGEEMASPDQVDDTTIDELWGMIPQTEDADKEMGRVSGTSQASREGKPTESTWDGHVLKTSKLKQVTVNRNGKSDQKILGKEQQKCVRNSDEGYWDSPTPVPEDELSRSIEKETLPRDSYSGDALYDLYNEPEEIISKPPSVEEVVTSLPHAKPLSPLTVTCPVKTSSFTKESKIPISIKHLPVHSPSPGSDSSLSSGSSVQSHHPVKSEMPRTKIPVSKVLVRRSSNRVITGTSGKPYHDPPRK